MVDKALKSWDMPKIVTAVIALAALGVSIAAYQVSSAAYQVSSAQRDIAHSHLEAIRNHQRLSVKPNVRVVAYLEGQDLRNGIYITNVGLGPAIIKSVQIIDGTTTHQLPGLDPWPLILANMHLDSLCFLKGHPIPDSVIRPGEELPFVAKTRAGRIDCDLPVASLVAKNSLRFKVAYESMYEEPFKFESTAVINNLEVLQIIELYRTK